MAGSAARCKSITFGTTAAENPISCAIIRDPELIKKVYSDSNLPRYYKGENVAGLRVTFADVALYKQYKKGDVITSLTVVIEKADEVVSTGGGGATDITATLSNGVVTEAVEFESSQDGAPVEYSVTVMIARIGTNLGTLTVT